MENKIKSGTLETVYCVHNKLTMNREFFYMCMYTQHILVFF